MAFNGGGAMTRRLVAIEAAVVLLLGGTARGDTLHLAAHLGSPADAARPRSAADGYLWADLDPHGRLFTYRLMYRRLTGPATGARLRGPVNAGQSTAGQSTPATVALSDTPSPITGEVTLTSPEAADVARGRWYVEIATSANPNGEIGGQVKLQDDQGEAQPPTGRPDQAPQASQLGWSPQLSW